MTTKASSRLTIDEKVSKAIEASGQKLYVDYSAYELDTNDEPIDNLNKVAKKGKVVVVREADEFWGGKKSRPYRSPVMESPTWLELTIHANRGIRATRDLHHVFFEGLEFLHKEDDIKVYRLSMGS